MKSYCFRTSLAIFLLAVAILAETANAWTLNRADLQKAASAAFVSAAIMVAPVAADAAPFAGSYADPKHPNCKRVIEIGKGNTALVSGTDGSPECPADGSGRVWNIEGKINNDEIFIDFSPKGGPKDLIGKWEETAPAGIRFPDGNKWTKK